MRSITPGDRAGWHARLLSRRGGRVEWLPLAAAVLVLTLAFGWWWALTAREHAQIRSLVDWRAALVLEQIQALLDSRTAALERMAARWEARGGTPRSEWEADAANYVALDPGFVALERVDADFTVRWVIPMEANQAAPGLDPAADQSEQAELERARAMGANVLTDPIEVIPGEQSLLIYSPLFVSGEFDGLLIGVISAGELFGHALPDATLDEVSIALLDDGEQFFGPERSGRLYEHWRVGHQIQVLNQVWRVEVWPNEPLLDKATTAIPAITLSMGIVVSALLALTILTAQRSRVRADELVNDSAIRDRQGELPYSSAVIRDITALKAAEHERDRLLRAERDQRRIAETLGRVALALSATLELESLVELICKESVSLFGVGAAFVWLVDGEDLVGRAGYGAGRQHFIGTRVPLDDPDTIGARVIRDRRPIYVNHAQTSEEANPELTRLFRVQSILGVPLLKGLRPVGALMILDTEDPERFGAEDLAMAAVLGSHVAVAVENARLYEQERMLAQMKDDFIAHVSHELRTPLHTLRGFIQLLRSGKVKDPVVERDFLERASHDADRLTDQVSELLEAAHIDATGLRLEYEAVDVGEIVQQTLDSIRIIADDRGVALHNFVPLRGPVIRSDERRLRQVVRNLVENAIQFSEAGSAVEVESEQRADQLLLTVRDQGPGIAAQALDQLFNRYYQVDGTARREKGGVGLGLYITRKIVEAHGGRIEVDSTLGEGSTFRAILPLDRPKAVEDEQL